jgi:hypothetical protein
MHAEEPTVVLLLPLIFMLQKRPQRPHLLPGAHGNPPLGRRTAARGDGRCVDRRLPGTASIIQLRRLAQRRAQSGRPAPAGPATDQPDASADVEGEAITPKRAQRRAPGQSAVA